MKQSRWAHSSNFRVAETQNRWKERGLFLPSFRFGSTLASLGTLTLLVIGGCAKSDLGTPCQLIAPASDGGVVEFVPPNQAADYISTGGADCENFTCIDSAGDEAPAYCSKRCNEDAQCRGGQEKDLVCRELVLDDAFITALRQSLGEDEFRQVFGDIQNARYCARSEGTLTGG